MSQAITAADIRALMNDPNLLPATAARLEALLIEAVKHDQQQEASRG